MMQEVKITNKVAEEETRIEEEKYLEQVISAMIPSSTCSSSDLTENGPVNNMVTQQSDRNTEWLEPRKVSKEVEKQVIVNNYYISDKETHWKQLMKNEILSNIPGTLAWPILSKILPNNTAIEHPERKTKTDTSKEDINSNEKINTTTESNKNTHVIVEPKRYHAEEGLTQNMAPPPVHNFSYPTPVRPTQTSETTAMLDCIHQLQLTLQQDVLTNSKQAEFQMSQNVDLFTEMIKVQNRRDLDPAVMAIPTFMGNES